MHHSLYLEKDAKVSLLQKKLSGLPLFYFFFTHKTLSLENFRNVKNEVMPTVWGMLHFKWKNKMKKNTVR